MTDLLAQALAIQTAIEAEKHATQSLKPGDNFDGADRRAIAAGYDPDSHEHRGFVSAFLRALAHVRIRTDDDGVSVFANWHDRTSSFRPVDKGGKTMRSLMAPLKSFNGTGVATIVLGLICSTIPLEYANAVVPPRYLSVPNFQQCLSQQSRGTYDIVCLPAARPAQCPAASWKALRRLSGDQKVPRCDSH